MTTTQVCIFNPTTNLIDVTAGVSVFTGSPATAGAPVVLNSSGAIDSSFFNSSPLIATAYEGLSAGDLVYLFYTNGVSGPGVYARLANAAHAASLPAMGFVTTSYIAGDPVTVLTTGLVQITATGFTTANIGSAVYLSTTVPGSCQLATPTNPDLIQPLGYIYNVFPGAGSPPTGEFVELPFLSFPLATVNQTPVATNSTFGVVKPDNTSITISAGVISATATSIATTSTVGVVKPDGTTINVNGSGLISVPTATTSVLGLVKPDGTSILDTAGAISVPTATTSVLGLVKPDGTTIDVTTGVISVPTATTSLLGLVKPDGTTVDVTSGVISVPTATSSLLGLVKPDGTTIHVTAGAISVPTATTSVLGLVKADGTTIAVNGSGVLSVTGFLPLTGGTLSGGLTTTGLTISGAVSGSFVNADGTGSTTLSSANLSDDASIIHGVGYAGYISLFYGTGSPPLSPPLSPPTSTNYIAESHLDDGVTTPGVITSTEPIFVHGEITASYLAPFIIYSAAGTPLPAASVSYAGVQAVVSDATTPSYMGLYVSGGTVTAAVICSIDTSASPPTYQWLTH